MLTDTHKRVLVYPVAATRQLVNEYGDDLTYSDDIAEQFGDVDAFYASAMDAPAEFERLVSSRVGGVWTCSCVKNIRAWVTLRFMLAWRTNFEAHDGLSRRFYKAFLEAELHALREAEAAQARA